MQIVACCLHFGQNICSDIQFWFQFYIHPPSMAESYFLKWIWDFGSDSISYFTKGKKLLLIKRVISTGCCYYRLFLMGFFSCHQHRAGANTSPDNLSCFRYSESLQIVCLWRNPSVDIKFWIWYEFHFETLTDSGLYKSNLKFKYIFKPKELSCLSTSLLVADL